MPANDPPNLMESEALARHRTKLEREFNLLRYANTLVLLITSALCMVAAQSGEVDFAYVVAALSFILAFFQLTPYRGLRAVGSAAGTVASIGLTTYGGMTLLLLISFNALISQFGLLIQSIGMIAVGSGAGIAIYRSTTIDALLAAHPPPPSPPPNELDSFDLPKWDEAPKP